MKKSIHPSRIEGQVEAPPSKSLTIRALVAALLAPEESFIVHPSLCDDAQTVLNLVQRLGAEVSLSSSLIRLKGGFPGNFNLSSKPQAFSCGESGLAIRLMAPLLSLLSQPVILYGRGTLWQRPMDMVQEALSKLGVHCSTRQGFPPLILHGPLQPGHITIKASRTSQLLSGLLMSLPLLKDESRIKVLHLRSRPYVDLTLEVMKKFNVHIELQDEKDELIFKIPGNQRYQGCYYKIEGDWSGASFLLVAGAIGGKVEVANLRLESTQADRRIIDALRAAGARVTLSPTRIIVEKGTLRSFDFDASDCPDLIPPLVALAASCPGDSRLFGAERLAYKESDRGKVLALEFSKIGVPIQKKANRLIISGGNIKGGETYSHHDHRIAMACAVAGLVSKEGVKIEGSQAVKKSFPGFFETLQHLGGKVQ
ncbi:3-phosphoshikimate 1-carboxyvinyltransferase [Candidatus Aminicenantes bacterium AC-334-K16]|jgi:3-phosphoshikimate 1-carboxyvinyltransferase|nr:3-phosphoshikimate 1-carboxyvinyltransferase [Candidatus Aminicenantes bacterium AC-334-K16]